MKNDKMEEKSLLATTDVKQQQPATKNLFRNSIIARNEMQEMAAATCLRPFSTLSASASYGICHEMTLQGLLCVLLTDLLKSIWNLFLESHCAKHYQFQSHSYFFKNLDFNSIRTNSRQIVKSLSHELLQWKVTLGSHAWIYLLRKIQDSWKNMNATKINSFWNTVTLGRDVHLS